MATTLPDGTQVPAGGDAYNLVPDLRKAFETHNEVVPVANVTARAALVSTLTAAGRGPTTSAPLYVNRQDAPPTMRIEVTYNGTEWAPIASGDTGWVTLTPNPPNFNTSNFELRKVGPQVFTRGFIFPTGSGTFPSTFTTVAYLPGAFRFSTYVEDRHFGATNSTYSILFQIDPVGGEIRARVPATGAYTTNTQFKPGPWLDL